MRTARFSGSGEGGRLLGGILYYTPGYPISPDTLIHGYPPPEGDGDQKYPTPRKDMGPGTRKVPETRDTLPRWTEWHTPVKILPSLNECDGR